MQKKPKNSIYVNISAFTEDLFAKTNVVSVTIFLFEIFALL